MKFIDCVHDAAEDGEKIIPHMTELRGMKWHEIMTDVIDCFVVRGTEIPGDLFHGGGRNRMQRDALSQALGERIEQPTNLGIALVELVRERNELREHRTGYFARMETQFSQIF